MASELGKLIITLGGEALSELTLSEGALSIGRTPDNDLALPDRMVSRRHARLRVAADGVYLTDLESTGGTEVDGLPAPANQEQLLSSGASIAIGPFVLVFQSAAAAIEEVDLPGEAGELFAVPTALQPSSAPPTRPPRRSWPASPAAGPRSRYLDYLSPVFQEQDFLGRMLLIFESVWEPLEHRQDHIPMYFDPATAPASLLPWLASWFGMGAERDLPEARRRALIAESVELYRWRGTIYGLTRMIEVCTGITPEIKELPELPFVFRVRVVIPEGSSVTRDRIEEIVRAHKPAHAGYLIDVTT